MTPCRILAGRLGLLFAMTILLVGKQREDTARSRVRVHVTASRQTPGKAKAKNRVRCFRHRGQTGVVAHVLGRVDTRAPPQSLVALRLTSLRVGTPLPDVPEGVEQAEVVRLELADRVGAVFGIAKVPCVSRYRLVG